MAIATSTALIIGAVAAAVGAAATTTTSVTNAQSAKKDAKKAQAAEQARQDELLRKQEGQKQVDEATATRDRARTAAKSSDAGRRNTILTTPIGQLNAQYGNSANAGGVVPGGKTAIGE